MTGCGRSGARRGPGAVLCLAAIVIPGCMALGWGSGLGLNAGSRGMGQRGEGGLASGRGGAGDMTLRLTGGMDPAAKAARAARMKKIQEEAAKKESEKKQAPAPAAGPPGPDKDDTVDSSDPAGDIADALSHLSVAGKSPVGTANREKEIIGMEGRAKRLADKAQASAAAAERAARHPSPMEERMVANAKHRLAQKEAEEAAKKAAAEQAKPAAAPAPTRAPHPTPATSQASALPGGSAKPEAAKPAVEEPKGAEPAKPAPVKPAAAPARSAPSDSSTPEPEEPKAAQPAKPAPAKPAAAPAKPVAAPAKSAPSDSSTPEPEEPKAAQPAKPAPAKPAAAPAKPVAAPAKSAPSESSTPEPEAPKAAEPAKPAPKPAAEVAKPAAEAAKSGESEAPKPSAAPKPKLTGPTLPIGNRGRRGAQAAAAASTTAGKPAAAAPGKAAASGESKEEPSKPKPVPKKAPQKISEEELMRAAMADLKLNETEVAKKGSALKVDEVQEEDPWPAPSDPPAAAELWTADEVLQKFDDNERFWAKSFSDKILLRGQSEHLGADDEPPGGVPAPPPRNLALDKYAREILISIEQSVQEQEKELPALAELANAGDEAMEYIIPRSNAMPDDLEAAHQFDQTYKQVLWAKNTYYKARVWLKRMYNWLELTTATFVRNLRVAEKARIKGALADRAITHVSNDLPTRTWEVEPYIYVPSSRCGDMREALSDAQNGNKICVRAGISLMQGPGAVGRLCGQKKRTLQSHNITVDGTEADGGASKLRSVVVGNVLLGHLMNGVSRGVAYEGEEVTHVSFLHVNPSEMSCISVFGSAWTFGGCKVVCGGGTAMTIADRGRVVVNCCLVGGDRGKQKETPPVVVVQRREALELEEEFTEFLDERGQEEGLEGEDQPKGDAGDDFKEYSDIVRKLEAEPEREAISSEATAGIVVLDSGALWMNCSTVEHVQEGGKGASIKQGGACVFMDRARGTVLSSTLADAKHAVTMDDAAKVRCKHSLFRDLKHGAFNVGQNASEASLTLEGNVIRGLAFHTASKVAVNATDNIIAPKDFYASLRAAHGAEVMKRLEMEAAVEVKDGAKMSTVSPGRFALSPSECRKKIAKGEKVGGDVKAGPDSFVPSS